MSATEDVRLYIRGSLIDLRRRLDDDTAVQIAQAVLEGAQLALADMRSVPGDRIAPPASPDAETGEDLARH